MPKQKVSKTDSKETRINVRTHEILKDRITKAASDKGVTFTDYVNDALEAYLEAGSVTELVRKNLKLENVS